MSYDGYFTLDGAEIANAARFNAYVGDKGWLRDTVSDLPLATVLEATYTDPATDLAPWYDPDEPFSGDFYGFLPLNTTGLEDSSRQGAVVESTGEGGIPGRIRHATKEVAISGVIAGHGEEACEYGMRWLRRTLLGALCSPTDTRKQATGVDLTYLSATPVVGEEEAPAQVLDRLTRVRRKVAGTRGPIASTTKRLGCGDVMWAVTFTLTCGDPFAYGATRRIISDLFTGTEVWGIEPPGVFTDFNGYTETVCGDPAYLPLYDPLCVTLINPPSVPNVPLACWTPPTPSPNIQRASIVIPGSQFPTWAEMLPVITLRNDSGAEMRNLRIRLFRDPGGDFDPRTDDPCSWVSDIVVSYLPEGTMVIDGVFEDVHHTTTIGQTRRADSLIFGSNLRPIVWPVLDCGVQFVMSVDVIGAATAPTVLPQLALDLVPRQV
jgi:hypothetical protein